jgi:serine/threonine-protein kinase RsbW
MIVSPELRLRITSDPANLAPTRFAVETMARAAGFDPRAVDEIGLVVNEALANVIRHAYQGAPGRPIEVQADVVDGEFRLCIRDWGSGKAPAELPECKDDPMKPGGLGLICLRQMMDEAQFVPQPDGMLLKLRRALRRAS